ncbi:NUDIX hydrolase [uncultured Rothia sp.]|uniref:NUDIX hydrolase n=1 Tax=uncultured Rothia sp. TaxID=316088 RepID=UPI0028891608|nr:NUDIX hydrolase [uncultured Rothia sp.]
MAPLDSPSIYYSARRFDAVNSIDRAPANTADIVASGALIWRMRDGALEVLIIHRPRYDDWSWPKGKQDPGESLAETAIREIREEVGLQVVLGVPLAVTSYPVGGRPKDVFYWAAELPDGARALADEGEVDELRWVTADEARALLTNHDDLTPLESLEALAEADALRTRPILIARHAKAKPRSNWAAAEDDRPLAATGKRQALASSRLFAAWAPSRIISSPWLRCVQTVTPYSVDYGVSVKEKKSLSEAGAQRHPARVARTVASLFDKDSSSLLCTHRPVLPRVMDVLREYLFEGSAEVLPTEDPYLEPGDTLVLQVTEGDDPRIVSVERVRAALD